MTSRTVAARRRWRRRRWLPREWLPRERLPWRWTRPAVWPGALGRIPVPPALRALVAARLRARGLGDADAAAGRCVLASVTGAAAAALLLEGSRRPFAVVAGAAGGWVAQEAAMRKAASARARAADAAIADALDMLAACVLGGMSVERALRTVAPSVDGVAGDALRDMLRALDVGFARRDAYRLLIERADGEEARRLVGCLERAERFGTPVAQALSAHAREARSRARARAEADARTAPVRLLFPLVLCFLPAFVLLTLVPLVLSAIKALRGI